MRDSQHISRRWLAPILLLILAVIGLAYASLHLQDGNQAASEAPVSEASFDKAVQPPGTDPAQPAAANEFPTTIASVDNPGLTEQATAALADSACPVQLPVLPSQVTYTQGMFTESWQAVSGAGCDEVALGLLHSLQDADTELVEAGYMDLSHKAWGCVVKSGEGESLTITLIPEQPFMERNDSNLLRMTIVRTRTPEI